MKPKTVPEALRAGADYIEKNGWMNLEHGYYEHPEGKCACAVTSITATVAYDPDLRMTALEALANAIEPAWIDSVWFPLHQPGIFVGHWNDEQLSKEPVIAKMREVADSYEAVT